LACAAALRNAKARLTYAIFPLGGFGAFLCGLRILPSEVVLFRPEPAKSPSPKFVIPHLVSLLHDCGNQLPQSLCQLSEVIGHRRAAPLAHCLCCDRVVQSERWLIPIPMWLTWRNGSSCEARHSPFLEQQATKGYEGRSGACLSEQRELRACLGCTKGVCVKP